MIVDKHRWARQRTGRRMIWAALALLTVTGCVSVQMLSTRVSAPDLSPQRTDGLSPAFDSEALAFVVWEKFEYVYGEGGEVTLGFVLAPPRVLPRDALPALGRATKSFPYSRKTRDGTDEGSWERGHRALALLLIAPDGETAAFIARDDPPRDFTVSWWPVETAKLSRQRAAALGEAMSCDELNGLGGRCGLGPFAASLDPDRLPNIGSPFDLPPLSLPFDEADRLVALRFLTNIH